MSSHQFISGYYDRLIEKYGINSIQSIGWTSGKQEIRFHELINYFQFKKYFTLLDLGCGRGDLFNYLTDMRSINTFEYLGCDVNLNFIEYASKRFDNINTCNFMHSQDDFPSKLEGNSYDFCVASGLLSSSFVTEDYRDNLLVSLYKICSKAMAFNLLTKDVDYEEEKYFYSEISDIIRLFEPISTKIIISKNKYLYEKTITIIK